MSQAWKLAAIRRHPFIGPQGVSWRSSSTFVRPSQTRPTSRGKADCISESPCKASISASATASASGSVASVRHQHSEAQAHSSAQPSDMPPPKWYVAPGDDPFIEKKRKLVKFAVPLSAQTRSKLALSPYGLPQAKKQTLVPKGQSLSPLMLQDIKRDVKDFPPPAISEDLAILQACLGGNLLTRAWTLFTEIRDRGCQSLYLFENEESTRSLSDPSRVISVEDRNRLHTYCPLNIHLFNTVFSAVFKRMETLEPAEAAALLERAATLFTEMVEGRFQDSSHKLTSDPLPTEATISVLAAGYAAIESEPAATHIRQRHFPALMRVAWKMGLNMDEIVSFVGYAGHTLPSAEEALVLARNAVQKMVEAAQVNGQDSAVDAIKRGLQNFEMEAQHEAGSERSGGMEAPRESSASKFPELNPVQSKSKQSPVDERVAEMYGIQDKRPINLTLLQKDLSVISSAGERFENKEEKQRWLENSALESAHTRLQASAERLAEAGLSGAQAAQSDKVLSSWIYQWMQGLEKSLKGGIKELKEAMEARNFKDESKNLQGARKLAAKRSRSGSGKSKDKSVGSKSGSTLTDGVDNGDKPRPLTSRGQSSSATTIEQAEIDIEQAEADAVAQVEQIATRLQMDEAEKTRSRHSPVNRVKGMEDYILPFLRLIPTKKLAIITVLEVIRIQGEKGRVDGSRLTTALVEIGKAIEQEYYNDIVRRNPTTVRAYQMATDTINKRGLTNLHARREALKLLQSRSASVTDQPWTVQMRVRVGAFLLRHLVQTATVRRTAVDSEGEVWDDQHPAFYTTYQHVQGKKVGILNANPAVKERMRKDALSDTLHPRNLPMLVKPRHWSRIDAGGYLINRNNIMRFKDGNEQRSLLQKAEQANPKEMSFLAMTLDVLGETGWNINEKVLKVMIDVWNAGDDTGDMPPLLDYKAPERPADYETNMRSRAKYLKRVRAAQTDSRNRHSRRCDANYKLEIARGFAGQTFYFPHNIDFRGRAYPIPPHFSHIGNDLCRGLLLFSEGKKLGARGERWLRIHLANVYGFDKANFEDRIKFTHDHWDDIVDSAENPLTGRRFWEKADDPWQCLATCNELVQAMRHPEGAEEYVCHLPVHQDGTCNGLQHYAALGSDELGATQVNLSEGDRPSDVYTAVADLVIDKTEKDAARGVAAAQGVVGRINRKVVKQTVMTTVYGVTFIGAREQVHKQLVDRGDVEPEDVYQCSVYLATNVLGSIGNLFTGAEQIQTWLSDSAGIIGRAIPPHRVMEAFQHGNRARKLETLAPSVSDAGGVVKRKTPAVLLAAKVAKEQMNSVIWTSPVGLPIIQPYRKSSKKQIQTPMQTVFLHSDSSPSATAAHKQASAFPPNFIHSLDATHMMLTAVECRNAGLTFASVHDSYWTHACDIDTMSVIIRQTFARLHNSPILPNLREEFIERFGDHLVHIDAATAIKQKRNYRLQKHRKFMRSLETYSRQLSEAEVSAMIAAEKKVEQQEEREDEDQEASEEEAELAKEEEEEEEQLQNDPPSSSVVSANLEESAGFTATFTEENAQTEDARKQYMKMWVPVKDLLLPVPTKGTFSLDRIKNSAYFFN